MSATEPRILGIHHITAIASDPQRNIDFYAGTLGLRLVKRTVNFDDPGSYHFYYGDAAGTPGTIVTFFAWPGLPARRGGAASGEVSAVAYAVPPGSVDLWAERLAGSGVEVSRSERFGAPVLSFADPDGTPLELVAEEAPPAPRPWAGAGVEAEHAVRGFAAPQLTLEGYERTAALLTGLMGFREVGREGDRFRFEVGEKGFSSRLDLVCRPGTRRARGGVGTVHHIAFRVESDEAQAAWREQLVAMGLDVSPIMDRNYFHSIYFREPGGILFELATDAPGFALDEDPATLGKALKLPAQYEPYRSRIEAALPRVTPPRPE